MVSNDDSLKDCLWAETQQVERNGKVIEIYSNLMGLRSWRLASQSSPNISEAVNKETFPLLQRNAPAPQQGLRSRGVEREQGIERWKRISPSLSSLTSLDGPQKTEAASSVASPSLSQALSIPKTRLWCCASPSSGFSSITITGRRISLSVPSLVSPETRPQNRNNKLPVSSASTMSPCDGTNQQESVAWGKPPVPLKRQASMMKVTEYRERDYTDERFASSLVLLQRSNSYTKVKRASKALGISREESALGNSAPERLVFRSCVNLELLRGPSSSMLYLDKSLSIPLTEMRERVQALHRSTLSLYLRGALRPGGPKRPGMRLLSRARSGRGMMAHGLGETQNGCCLLEGVTTVDSQAVGGGSSSEQLTLAPLPFRAKRHSSSAVFRMNGKANDVSRPRREGAEGPEAVINKRLVSPVVIKNSSAVDSVRCHSQQPQTQNSSHSQHAGAFYTSRSLLGLTRANALSNRHVSSGVNVRISSNGRGPCSHAKPAVRGQACPVSPHVLDCTGESKGTNQLQGLSLKEALEHFRPDFISRSQQRVRQMEERQRQRQSSCTAHLEGELEGTRKRQNCTKPHPLSDNLFKPKDRVISGKEMQRRSKRIYNKLPEVTKKKEEERRRLVLQSNRLRAEVFKKKLLDQILQRNSD